MAIREIVKLPDPILKKISQPVERVDDELRVLVDDMLATMYDAPGIGLAAVQIGVPRRLLVVDTAKDEQPKPDVFDNIERPAQVRVSYLDRDGKQHEDVYEGLMATVLQHEIDHLNGILFIDYLSRLKRGTIVRKFTKLARQQRENV